ncbi:hypothetical protein N8T08_011190 [Aspergillus melleus]|uniref:Uncharacterized protein n=1 Tax=Aspergillus melleus TaxID=138277 RepID=A0ACC3AQB0_9EURO|nr:hypothetical protein N8T08_011190 [Aspergillus melleus]
MLYMKTTSDMADLDKHHDVPEDDVQLARMGHKAELQRNFSTLSMLGLAFAVLNVRLVTAGTCNLCIAASLAEFLSAYPTAGGQYHWVAVGMWHDARLIQSIQSYPIDPAKTNRIAKPSILASIALVATNALLSSQLIAGIVSAVYPGFVWQRWQQFLIYVGYTILAFVVNAFMNSVLPVIYRGAFTWSIGGFVLVSITVLACASPDYSSAYFVFCDFVNQTGWPDGVAWLLGLLQGGLGVTAFDAVAHMIEEVPQPSIRGPKIMVSCVGIGTFTGAVFLIVLLFVAGDIDEVINSSAGPLLQIFLHATKNTAGAICLLMLPLVCLAFATLSVMTTSSRMIFAFARAFNAIISSSVVALDLSYAMPIAVNCLRGRNILPDRYWKVPSVLGWVIDMVFPSCS